MANALPRSRKKKKANSLPVYYKRSMHAYERSFAQKGYTCLVGVDEAGRGPLAGPVVAAAVVLPKYRFKNRIDDSKKLTASQRLRAFLEITDRACFGIGIVNEQAIDTLNIRQATRVAMERAVQALFKKLSKKQKKKLHILVDGNMSLQTEYPCTAIIRGDERSSTIACSSILAKVLRDRIMCMYDRAFPLYGFAQHKGYPTVMHREAIKRFGPSCIHRLSFYGVR